MYFSKKGANKGQCPPPLVIGFGIFMNSCKSILLECLYKIDLCSPSNKEDAYQPLVNSRYRCESSPGPRFDSLRQSKELGKKKKAHWATNSW